jgi:predicted DNA-binding protein
MRQPAKRMISARLPVELVERVDAFAAEYAIGRTEALVLLLGLALANE